jgi:hypothetical protein
MARPRPAARKEVDPAAGAAFDTTDILDVWESRPDAWDIKVAGRPESCPRVGTTAQLLASAPALSRWSASAFSVLDRDPRTRLPANRDRRNRAN